MKSESFYNPVEEFNKGHILEGLDRCWTIQKMLSELLDNHPAIVKCGANEEITAIIERVGDVYQKVGQLRDE